MAEPRAACWLDRTAAAGLAPGGGSLCGCAVPVFAHGPYPADPPPLLAVETGRNRLVRAAGGAVVAGDLTDHPASMVVRGAVAHVVCHVPGAALLAVVKTVDMRAGAVVREAGRDAALSIYPSLDEAGGVFYVGGREDGLAAVDAGTGRLIARGGDGGMIESVAVDAAHGRVLYGSTNDAGIRCVSMDGLRPLPALTDRAAPCAVAVAGDRVYSFGYQDYVREFSAATGENQRSVHGPDMRLDEGIESARVSPDGEWLALAHDRGRLSGVHMIRLRDGERRWLPRGESCYGIDFERD